MLSENKLMGVFSSEILSLIDAHIQTRRSLNSIFQKKKLKIKNSRTAWKHSERESCAIFKPTSNSSPPGSINSRTQVHIRKHINTRVYKYTCILCVLVYANRFTDFAGRVECRKFETFNLRVERNILICVFRVIVINESSRPVANSFV